MCTLERPYDSNQTSEANVHFQSFEANYGPKAVTINNL